MHRPPAPGRLLPIVFIILGCGIMAVGFTFFPSGSAFDLEDILFESAFLTATVVAYYYASRLDNQLLELGFGTFAIALLIDLLDEFTREPGLLNTQIEGFLKIIGLVLIVAGLHAAYRTLTHNIARAKEREEELRKSEENYRSLVENISEVVCEIDAEGRLRYISPKISDLLGYSSRSLVGRTLPSLSAPASQDELAGNMADIIGERKPFSFFEHSFVHRNGNAVQIQTNGTPIFDEDGSFKGFRIVCRNITEKKNIELALLEANTKLNLLSNITRHDVINQLTVIMGLIEIMQDSTVDPALLNLLGKEQRAARQIHYLISFTRDYQEVGIHTPVWQKVADAAGHAARAVDLGSIVPAIACEGIEVFADPLFEKVFFSLFENTVRHGNSAAHITISCRESSDGVVISYEDDGPGIPDDEKELIFERGYGKNTGYGLFLARDILSLTGIGIVETGVFGQGVRFELRVSKDAVRSVH